MHITIGNHTNMCDWGRLSRQNEMIMNAHRTVLETEEAGEEILGELGRNREKILSSREKVC
ncbi:hypothetical protein EON65_43070 [archaeon]|nr:MAG: hypothetical protein EON65_43070 [archaeon]